MTKEEKIQHASALLPVSPGFRANVVLTANQWVGILKSLDEKKIDELLLVLEEEKGMNQDVETEKLRKLTINQTAYLQRLEKLKVRMESLRHKAPNNA